MATNTTVTRRSLVGACLAETVGLLANAPTARAAEAERTWDAECDVLIVGSGYTGLAAAIEANAAGADVKIIDKRASFGGNSIIADGGMRGRRRRRTLGPKRRPNTRLEPATRCCPSRPPAPTPVGLSRCQCGAGCPPQGRSPYKTRGAHRSSPQSTLWGILEFGRVRRERACASVHPAPG